MPAYAKGSCNLQVLLAISCRQHQTAAQRDLLRRAMSGLPSIQLRHFGCRQLQTHGVSCHAHLCTIVAADMYSHIGDTTLDIPNTCLHFQMILFSISGRGESLWTVLRDPCAANLPAFSV